MSESSYTRRNKFIKGFKGQDSEPLPEELSEEEQAQQDALDAEAKAPLKDKITKSIINLLKKKGPPAPGR